MRTIFHPEAEAEFFAAIDYYEEAETGLGQRFSLEVMASINRIATLPLAWPKLSDDIRRCLTNRFPFGIIYSVEADAIFILAVMHLRREPDYWRERR